MSQQDLLLALADAVDALLDDATRGKGSALAMSRINALRRRIQDAKRIIQVKSST